MKLAILALLASVTVHAAKDLNLVPGSSLNIQTPKGAFVLKVDAEAPEIIGSIEKKRREVYSKTGIDIGTREDELQSKIKMARPEESRCIVINSAGTMLGVFRHSRDVGPRLFFNYMWYDLSDAGNATEVRLAKCRVNGDDVLAVRTYDQTKKEYVRLILYPFDSFEDSPSPTFRSICKQSAGS